MTFMMVGVFGGFVLAMVMAFKMKWASVLAPAFAILEGLFVGSISAIYNDQYKGLPMEAVALTLLVTLFMFLIYRFKIIRVTSRFKKVVIIATLAVASFYMIQWLSYAFSGSFFAYSFTNSSTPLSIGFSIVMVVLASLNLLLNFDMIDKGIEMGAPKYMEWYSSFGLLVTIVWLYLELLRLLSKFQRN